VSTRDRDERKQGRSLATDSMTKRSDGRKGTAAASRIAGSSRDAASLRRESSVPGCRSYPGSVVTNRRGRTRSAPGAGGAGGPGHFLWRGSGPRFVSLEMCVLEVLSTEPTRRHQRFLDLAGIALRLHESLVSAVEIRRICVTEVPQRSGRKARGVSLGAHDQNRLVVAAGFGYPIAA
jgi:hypothetical protein